MVRFLVLFSYLGRNFSGLQVQTYSPVKTVVGVLQYAFTKLVHQIDYPGTKDQAVKFVTSSRTDRGVSALCNAGHVDIYSPKILRMMRVPDDFHSRYNALSRSYVYRVCCLGNRNVPVPTALDVPLLERQTCLIIRQQLDMESVQKAAQLLTGRHDFRAFTTPTNRRLIEDDASNNNNKDDDEESDIEIESVKDMEVKVQSGQGALDEYVDYLYGGRMKIWDFHFRAHSFLYRQVRKMVGAMPRKPSKGE
ncbi:hypothetical protein HELRODRAFT_169921 [Helobdella robusta]|uniref:tRNA pseudouridine synthase n=1 Tax=Helobdella robusta TaxID=6412 RepID=T1F2G2_HELRO|nr:hypothetical protein HELRODRAFT_169921 [Helobdella robusta]ESO08183.1 hypothetical protein HELRODRAFT_169921 [Helobdella robusta]